MAKRYIKGCNETPNFKGVLLVCVCVSENEERTVLKERSKIDSTVSGRTYTSRIAVKTQLGKVRRDR